VAHGGLVTGFTLFVTSQYDFRFTVPDQCFDKFCFTQHPHIHGRRSSGREGSSNGVEGNEKFSKNKKKALQIMFVSFINNVDLKNNNKNYRKSF